MACLTEQTEEPDPGLLLALGRGAIWYDYLTNYRIDRSVNQQVVANLGGEGPGSAPGTQDELNLGLLLFIPYRAMEKAVLEALAAAGYPITLAQARVFQRIDQDGSRITDLAEAAVLTKQTVGFLVDQLERAGYVERTPDPRDGRARLVRVAARGAAAVQASMSVVAEVEARWTAYLGETRTAQLRQALTMLREITDPYQATDWRSKHSRG
jgi:DNA-binding MarR family transcriptional regulator